GQACNPAAAAVPLERSFFAVTLRPLCGKPDMPHFACKAVCPLVEPAVQDEPRPHARSEGQENHVAGPAPRTKTPFGQRARICIILQACPAAQRALQLESD